MLRPHHFNVFQELSVGISRYLKAQIRHISLALLTQNLERFVDLVDAVIARYLDATQVSFHNASFFLEVNFLAAETHRDHLVLVSALSNRELKLAEVHGYLETHVSNHPVDVFDGLVKVLLLSLLVPFDLFLSDGGRLCIHIRGVFSLDGAVRYVLPFVCLLDGLHFYRVKWHPLLETAVDAACAKVKVLISEEGLELGNQTDPRAHDLRAQFDDRAVQLHLKDGFQRLSWLFEYVDSRKDFQKV